MRWVLDEGLVEDQQSWAVQAELSEGAVRGFMFRSKKSDGATMKPQELQQLARAAKVSYEWLSAGVGEPLGDQARKGKFALGRDVFLDGFESDPEMYQKATDWLASRDFRLASTMNAEQILHELKVDFRRYLEAIEKEAAGGTSREIALALGGIGSRVDDTPDEDSKPLPPLKKRKPR